MNVAALLVQLSALRRSGDGWIGRCPGHADRSPSLAIHERDGKILLHCFAGCSVESVCAALNIEMRDLFMEPCAAARKKPQIVRYAAKQIAPLRSVLTRLDRERAITVVLADLSNVDAAIARALALAVEGELAQVVLKESER